MRWHIMASEPDRIFVCDAPPALVHDKIKRVQVALEHGMHVNFIPDDLRGFDAHRTAFIGMME